MNQRANAGYEQRHRDAERVSQQSKVNLQCTNRNPLKQRHYVRALFGGHTE